MKEFIIEITETLQKQIKTKADNVLDAISKVKEQYYQVIVELNENDLVDVKFQSIESIETQKGQED